MTFSRITEVLPKIVSDALKGFTIYYDEGLDLDGLKAKYSLNSGNTIYINLNGFNVNTNYMDIANIITARYDIYINTDQDSLETYTKLHSEIVNSGAKHFITLNGNEHKIYIIDLDTQIINETEKFINFQVEIYV